MNQKKNFYVVTIIMVGVLCLNIISCSSDKEEDVVIDTTPIMLYSGNDKTIQGAETITSSNEFVAYSKGNVIHGDHVGEASLLVNGKYTISVNVLPNLNSQPREIILFLIFIITFLNLSVPI